MRVVLNALCITNRSGTGRYAWGLIHGLLRQSSPDWFFSIVIPTDFSIPSAWQKHENARFYSISLPSTLRRILWEQRRLPGLTRAIKPDLLHSLAFIAPVFETLPIKQIVTIHDLAFLHYPKTVPLLRRLYYQWIIPRSWSIANAAIADSKTIAAELAALPNAPRKIVPIQLGVNLERFTPAKESLDKGVLARYSLNTDYFLFVGTREPRKNLPTILQAYAAARGKGCCRILVIVGRRGWMENEMSDQPGVFWLDHVNEEHLPALYRGARAALAPSLYEGYDLPPMEALACGTPVIASDIPVHRETLGENAVFIPPRDIQAWADILQSFPEKQTPFPSQEIRDWDQVARETLTVYRDAGA